MAGLMNRTRGMAEGVVVMVCPVLLALALDKINRNAFRRGAFHAMLTMSCLTLITGICPVLLCSFSQRFPSVSCVRVRLAAMTSILATISSSCLLVLACFIAQLIVSDGTLIAVSIISGLFVLCRFVCYYRQKQVVPYPPGLYSILDESHEFLTGVTGIIFLGLEGLALESHDNSKFQKGAGAVGTISLIVCVIGVCLMFFEMIPPVPFNSQAQIVVFTLALDFVMSVGTFVLLAMVMYNLLEVLGLFILTPMFGILCELGYRMITEPRQVGIITGNPAVEVTTPASLELTRVTFTGFLAVSITAIKIKNSSDDSYTNITSPSKLTKAFLLFAALAIVCGISWRLLTQSQIRIRLANSMTFFKASPAQVASSANLASLCTHFSIVIATILFLAMAWSK